MIPLQKRPVTLLILLFISMYLSAQDISVIIHNGDTVISASEDGFMVIWDAAHETVIERFQLTPYTIKAMVKHPSKNEICILETGDIDNYRITAWDYRLKKRLFSVQSAEPVNFINYSANGSFIITTGFIGRHLTTLDSGTGEILSRIVIPEGNTIFGITGRSERNILLYQSELDDISYFGQGQILYLDLVSQTVTGSFQAPAKLTSPVTFGNNRYIAGINSSGLLLIDAASGSVLDTNKNIKPGSLLYSENNEFYCISNEDTPALLRFTAGSNGKLVSRQRIPLAAEEPINAVAVNGNVIFACGANMYLVGPQGALFPFKDKRQTRITDIAAGKDNIAVLTENSGLFFIPLDYNLLEEAKSFIPVNKNNYTRLTAIPAAANQGDQFIIWQNVNTRTASQIVKTEQQAAAQNVNLFPGRFPIRSISSKGSNILVLDTAGNIAVRRTDNLTNAKANFTLSSVGATDAAIVDDNYFFLSRSVINRNSPYLVVNHKTGETVPVSLAGAVTAGILVFSGSSGSVYAASVQRDINAKTLVTRHSISTSSETRTLLEYPGELSSLSIAESSGAAAIAAGSEGAKIYGNSVIDFERSSGLPVKLLGSDNFFLALDSEGNITWHDNKTGRILAAFRIYESQWVLLKSGSEITGELAAPRQ